jgi:hypothetical protein
MAHVSFALGPDCDANIHAAIRETSARAEDLRHLYGAFTAFMYF